MKTKNIFRMLLVAAALLMGANNVKADETQIWPTNGTINTERGNCSISKSVFDGFDMNDQTIIRVYCGPVYGDGGYWQLEFYANGSNPEFSSGFGDLWGTQVVTSSHTDKVIDSHIDLECSANTVAKLTQDGSSGFSINVTGIIISSVAIVTGGSGGTTEKQNSSIVFGGNVELTFGETFTLPTVTTTPANATITYSTDDDGKKVVFISQDGSTIIPVGEGTATITGTFAGDNSYNGTTATFTVKVNKPSKTDAVWTGAVWLGDFGGQGGSQPRFSISEYFSNVQSGEYLRFYGTVGPMNGTYWKLEIVDPTWKNPRLFAVDLNDLSTKLSGENGFEDGYIDIPVDDVDLSNIEYIILNGHNLTITAIELIRQQQQPTTYTVTVSAGSNGLAYANPTSTTAGQSVIITTSPNTDYEVDAVTVEGVNVTKTSNNTYTFQMPAHNVMVYVTFKPVPVETVEYAEVYIGDTHCATYSNTSSAINFAGVSGLKAYIATAIDLDQNNVTLTQVRGTVAAGTGVVLISDNNQTAGTFNLPKSTSTGTSYDNNLLLASDANTFLSHTDASFTYYVLVNRNGVAKFAEVYSYDAQPGANKAYLCISKVSHARMRSLSFEFNDGTTGINDVENAQNENVIYNLRGQRVENPTKGLYIINGKKVILK